MYVDENHKGMSFRNYGDLLFVGGGSHRTGEKGGNYIGKYSLNTPDMYVVGGFNKWGMTGAMVSAMILSNMVMGRRNDYHKPKIKIFIRF